MLSFSQVTIAYKILSPTSSFFYALEDNAFDSNKDPLYNPVDDWEDNSSNSDKDQLYNPVDDCDDEANKNS